MKFRKKPIDITAERFNGEDPNIEGIEFAWFEDEQSWKIYNVLHKSWIQIKVGDYFRTDIVGDNYPIDAEYMKENYDELV